MRGQVTAFAIIGVLMLIAVLSLFWISRAPNTEPETQRPNLDLEACIEEEAGLAILEAGLIAGKSGEQRIGTAAQDLGGLSPYHTTYVALYAWKPSHFPVENRPSRQLVFDTSNPLEKTGTNRFPTFTDVSTTTTSLIEDRVGDNCEDIVQDLTVTSVTYSNENIRIEARAIEQGRSPREVTVSLPVPLRRYHEILAAAIRKDNSDPEFLFSTLTTDGFSIRILSDINNEGDSVLVLESDQPLIGSKSYLFLTIIKDRPPVFIGTDFDALGIGCIADSVTGSAPYFDPDDGDAPSFSCRNLDLNRAEYTFTTGAQTYSFEASP